MTGNGGRHAGDEAARLIKCDLGADGIVRWLKTLEVSSLPTWVPSVSPASVGEGIVYPTVDPADSSFLRGLVETRVAPRLCPEGCLARIGVAESIIRTEDAIENGSGRGANVEWPDTYSGNWAY